jgi:carbon-monoxide dehydrogenase large subunit
MSYVGSRVRRVEDPRLVRGDGCYVGDLQLPGMLHVGFVRSPYSSATITSIDLIPARAVPGVVAAFSSSDLPALARPAPYGQVPANLKGHGVFPLAVDAVRYQGEAVVAVLAEDPYALADGIEAVVVEYDAREAVASVDEALAARHLVWEDVPGNVAAETTLGFGDTDEAFEGAPVVLEESFTFPRSACAAIEPRAVAAAPGGEHGERVTVWSSTQAPHIVRTNVAGYLGLEPEEMRVIAPDVGGGFGPKGRTYPEEYVIAALALQVGRPVRWVATRTEDMETTAHGRGQVHHVRLAAERDGSILAIEDHIIQDAGAYTPGGVIVPLSSARHMLGPYRVPAARARITGVYTNRVMTSPLRGGGRPQGIYVMERMLDRLSQHLNLDRAEIRRRNLIPPEAFPYDTGMPLGGDATMVYDSGNYPAYLDRVLDAIGYAGFPDLQAKARGEGRAIGLGLTVFIESTGTGSEGARVEVDDDGSVGVFVGSPDNGQGHATTFGQMAADRLGVDLSAVRITSGDTGAFSWGTGTFASRMGQYGGNAVSLAARAVHERALRVAADMLEIAPDDLELRDGTVTVRGVPGRSLTLAEVAREVRGRGERLEESRPFEQVPPSTYAGGANAAIVEVDVETGLVKILRYVVVHDSGTIVNPAVVEGQIHGGVVHGIGNGLYEEFVYGPAGELINPSFADYALTLIGDAPTIEIIHFETPSPYNPEGIKGAGEGGTIGGIPTVVSAVEDALRPFGLTINNVPIKPGDLARKTATWQVQNAQYSVTPEAR